MDDPLPWQKLIPPEVISADDLRALEVREAAKRVRLGDPIDAVARTLGTSPVELAKAMVMVREWARAKRGPLSEADLALVTYLRRQGASIKLLACLFKQEEKTMRSNLRSCGFRREDP